MTEDQLRAEFEAIVGARDSFGLKRSRRGTYINPAIARDWKWFRLGAAAGDSSATSQAKLNAIERIAT